MHDRLGVIVLILAAAGALLAQLPVWRADILTPLRVYLRLMLVTVELQVVWAWCRWPGVLLAFRAMTTG
jgi:hypothetical protein